MYCKHCGTLLNDNAKFCTGCGKKTDLLNQPVISENQKSPVFSQQNTSDNLSQSPSIAVKQNKGKAAVIITVSAISVIIAIVGIVLFFILSGNNPMFDFLPKIDYTPVEDLIYHYDDNLVGIKVTRYTGDSDAVRIPDTIDGKPVVSVDLGLNQLNELILPDSVEELYFDYRVKYINYPRNLKPNIYDTALKGFNRGTFDQTEIEKIYIPAGVTELYDFEFMDCENLKEVYIPSTITEIGNRVFDKCVSLDKISIPSNIKHCGRNIFNNCPNVKITYNGNTYTHDNIDDFYYAILGSEYSNNSNITTTVAASETVTTTVATSDTVTTTAAASTTATADMTITTADTTTVAASDTVTTTWDAETTTTAETTTANTVPVADESKTLLRNLNGIPLYCEDAYNVTDDYVFEFDFAIMALSKGIQDENEYEYNYETYNIIKKGDIIAGHKVSEANLTVNSEGAYTNRVAFEDEITLSGTISMYSKAYNRDEGDMIYSGHGDISFKPDNSYIGLPVSCEYCDTEVFRLGNLFKDYDENAHIYKMFEGGNNSTDKKVIIKLTDVYVEYYDGIVSGITRSTGKIVSIELQ